MTEHDGVHFQREETKNIVLKGQRAFEASDQVALRLEIGIHIVPGALFVDGIGKALRPPLIHFNDVAALFLDKLRNPIYQIPDLVVAEYAADDIRKFVGVFRHSSLWNKITPAVLAASRDCTDFLSRSVLPSADCAAYCSAQTDKTGLRLTETGIKSVASYDRNDNDVPWLAKRLPVYLYSLALSSFGSYSMPVQRHILRSVRVSTS